MTDKACTIRTRKFLTNPLLCRQQFVVDVIHPGRPTPSKTEIREQLLAMYQAHSLECISVFGFRTQFGGGKSTGFGLIYDDKEALMRFEPKHRQARIGLLTLKSGSRKQMKERRRRAMKHRGQKKAEILGTKKEKKK